MNLRLAIGSRQRRPEVDEIVTEDSEPDPALRAGVAFVAAVRESVADAFFLSFGRIEHVETISARGVVFAVSIFDLYQTALAVTELRLDITGPLHGPAHTAPPGATRASTRLGCR